MRITKNMPAKWLFAYLFLSIIIQSAQAETTLAPVTDVKLSEAPPPWEARADVVAANYSDDNKAEEADLISGLDISAASIPLDNNTESVPLSLEDNNAVNISNDIAQAEVDQPKKKGLFGKLFSRKNKKQEEPVKQYAEQTRDSNGSGIESWYRNRQQAGSLSQSSSDVEQRAAQGDSDAQYQLGLMYRSGEGVEENIYQAIHWLTRSANANNAQAQYALALLYKENSSKPQDANKALKWYQRAANSGHADAQYSLGLLYANGDSVPQDGALAKKWFKQSATQGNMAAQIALAASIKAPALNSEQSIASVSKEPIDPYADTESQAATTRAPLALEEQAVVELDAPSTTRYADSQAKPVVKPVENIASHTTIDNNAAVEEPHEQIRVASITAPPRRPVEKVTLKGAAQPEAKDIKTVAAIAPVNTPTVEKKARPPAAPTQITDNTNTSNIDVASIQRGAHAGDAKSQLLYGSLYEDGEGGFTQDYAEAAKWYRKAADQGYAQAQYNLGLLYEDGKGTDQDFYEASQWYKRAANNDFAEAQNNLAVLYIMGKGVIKDRNRAELWFRRAIEQGNPNAERNLTMLLNS